MEKKKNKHRKMDPYFVSDQPWEIGWIADKFGVERKLVRQVKRDLKTVSRKRIYNAIRYRIKNKSV